MDKELLHHKASQYLKNPKIIQKFKLNYLSSLNTFLDDKNFSLKIQDLPKLKSQVINKYEKSMDKMKKEKDDRERLKKSEAGLDMKTINTNNDELSSKYLNLFESLKLIILKDYIIKFLFFSKLNFFTNKKYF